MQKYPSKRLKTRERKTKEKEKEAWCASQEALF